MNLELIERVEETLTRLISEFTVHHTDLKISSAAMSNSLTVFVQAHRGDTPRIIGKLGNHYNALAGILDAIGNINNVRITLAKIKDPVTGEKDLFPQRSSQFNVERFVLFMGYLCAQMFHGLPEITHKTKRGETILQITVLAENGEAARSNCQKNLQTICNAIGKANQHTITISIVAQHDPQPKTAAGRYAGCN